MDYINSIMDYLNGSGWMLAVFLVVFITAVVNFFASLLLKRLHKKFTQTRNMWDESIVSALSKPFGFLIWVFGLTFAADITGKFAEDKKVFELVAPVREVALLILFVWFLIRLIKEVERNLLKQDTSGEDAFDATTVHAIGKLVRLSVIITSVLAGLQMFGVNISAVLAFGGIGGIAIGFAAKDLLANFFGGMMIFLDRPFNVGDWVCSPDRNIEGVVDHIGWRLTRITSFDKRPMYVPNSIFSTIVLENPSRMHNRRINTVIGVRYDDAKKLEAIVNDVNSMLHTHENIDQSQSILVNFSEFAGSSLNFLMSAFTKTTQRSEFLKIQQDVFFKVIDIIDEHGAECAFPTQTLHIPDGLSLHKQVMEK